MQVLVTGVAGFCGLHVAQQLLARGDRVIGIDNFSPYYDVGLKRARLAQLQGKPGFAFHAIDICDAHGLRQLFATEKPVRVVHLAGQPGVRHSLTHPEDYIQTNLVGFANVLEACRHGSIEHLVYASSSSVYGANKKVPYTEQDNVDHPVSLYAATKKANELLAHSYSHLFRLPTTGLRYFTVYGPWGRPDMAPWLFTEAILRGQPIQVFNAGRMLRDFTFVEDVAEATVRALDRVAEPDPAFETTAPRADISSAPYRVYNVGNEAPVQLLHFIKVLETVLGREALKQFQPLQPGDLEVTRADASCLRQATGFAPSTPIEVGLQRWADWYRQYHRIDAQRIASSPI